MKTLKASLFEDYYVYALLDPRYPGCYKYGHWTFKYKPFYIGMGKNGRLNSHDEYCPYNKFKARVITKIKKEGFDDCIRVKKKKHLTCEQAFSLEINLIAKIGRRDLKQGPLTNLTNGGEGAINPSKHTRKKISKTVTETFKQKPQSEKDEVQARRATTKSHRTQEQKLNTKQLLLETYSSKTEKEKSATSKRHSKAHKNRLPEVEALRCKKISETLKNKSDREKKEIRDKKVASMLNSPNEETRREKISKTLSGRSKKQVKKTVDKIQLALNSKTPEQKEATRLKRQQTWANKTVEQREEKARKTRETLARSGA